MTAARPAGLPNFKRPPLNELVLSVQFGSLPFKNVHAGLLWQKFSTIYPRVEEQPALEPVFETFGAPTPAPQISFQLMSMVGAAIRYWFISPDGNELLQVQGDRLLHNWRQQDPQDEYPRYEGLKEKFAHEIAVAASFFRESGFGEMSFNQCEVSYINVIDMPDGQDPNARLDEVLTIISSEHSDTFLPPLERGILNFSYVLPGESGNEPLGRLHINVQPVVHRKNNRPAVRLHLTARGNPNDSSLDAALAWLDKGREAAVKGFASITTQNMHRLWERTNQ